MSFILDKYDILETAMLCEPLVQEKLVKFNKLHFVQTKTGYYEIEYASGASAYFNTRLFKASFSVVQIQIIVSKFLEVKAEKEKFSPYKAKFSMEEAKILYAILVQTLQLCLARPTKYQVLRDYVNYTSYNTCLKLQAKTLTNTQVVYNNSYSFLQEVIQRPDSLTLVLTSSAVDFLNYWCRYHFNFNSNSLFIFEATEVYSNLFLMCLSLNENVVISLRNCIRLCGNLTSLAGKNVPGNFKQEQLFPILDDINTNSKYKVSFAPVYVQEYLYGFSFTLTEK